MFYTGALCGLGWNSQTQEGILPEHDIELSFDVRFDVEDITEVKQLSDSCGVTDCSEVGRNTEWFEKILVFDG